MRFLPAPAVALLWTLGACAPAPYAASIEHSQRLLQQYVEATGVPGLQVAVAIDGRLVWSEQFGFADRDAGVATMAESQFRIASISKLLTGTLAASLATKGLLDLDRPLGEYVGNIPVAWQTITSRMLLHHTSGIAHYSDAADGLDTTHYTSTRDAIRRFRDRPLVHAPGTAEAYSSYAYTLLALAIETTAQRPFTDVMRVELLDPLGMARTVPDDRTRAMPARTAFYDLDSARGTAPAPFTDLSGRWAGSGYLSTAEDLVRFGTALTATGALDQSVRRMVAERDTLPDGALTREGFGWGPREDWDGRTFLWGDGGTPGARGGLIVYPAEGLVIAILGNARGLKLERGEFQTLARLFLAERDGHRPHAPDPAVLGHWDGTITARQAVPTTLVLTATAGIAQGKLSIRGWRELTVIDAFATHDTTWVVTMDAEGFLPAAITLSDGRLHARLPRAGLEASFERRDTVRP